MLRNLQKDFQRATLKTGRLTAIPGVVSDRIAASDRLDIYRNNVLSSLVDVLAAAYPACKRLIGKGNFAVIATEFAIAHPPKEPQLLAYGARFSEFISGHGEAIGEYPFLSDLARLEWARNDAYFAANADTITATYLETIPQENYPSLKFELHPSVTIIRSEFPIHHFWGLSRLRRPWSEGREIVLVYRKQMMVYADDIGPGMAGLIEAFADGRPLEAAAEAAFEADAAFDLQTALTTVLGNGIFSKIT